MAGSEMPLREIDISWEFLRRIVRDWAGAAAELAEVKPLEGGAINTTLALGTADGARAVLKITPLRVNKLFEREAYQLNVLRAMGLPVPEVYACHVASLDEPNSYLLMQFMPGIDLQQARERCSPEQYEHLQMHLAELVLMLHEQTAGRYGRLEPQADPQFEQWPQFYRHVYDPILAEASKSGLLAPKVRKQMAKVHERLESLLSHGDRPRLVHSDIWATNILAHPDEHGRWWVTGVLDPNCKYAHAEAEIAYMELFHTITPAFLRAYQQTHRLPPEYHQTRKAVYQLYPLLNHVRLFGQDYVKPFVEMLGKVK